MMAIRRAGGSLLRAIFCICTGALSGVAGVYRHSAHAAEAKVHTTWSAYEGGVDSAQYSALKQINKSNVSQLQQVWFYSAAGAHRFEFSPIIVDGVMYVIGKNDNVVALDAATGRELWIHDTGKPHMISERGFTYWESKDRSDRRLFFATDNILHAVAARTGKLIESFGNQGSVDLRKGSDATSRASVRSNPEPREESLKIYSSWALPRARSTDPLPAIFGRSM